MSPWLMNRWWDFWKTAAVASCTALFSMRFTGLGHVPRTGPVLFLSNHQSFLDPVLIGLSIPRYARFVHRETLQKSKKLTWVMNSLRGIPIDHRGFSREGLDVTLESLSKGDCVVMFPEGERSHDGELGEFKPGISLLIKRTKAPIVPIGLVGAYDAWPRTSKLPRLSPILMPPGPGTIAVSIGTPIDPAHFETMRREPMLKELRDAVAKQMEHAESIRRKRRDAL